MRLVSCTSSRTNVLNDAILYNAYRRAKLLVDVSISCKNTKTNINFDYSSAHSHQQSFDDFIKTIVTYFALYLCVVPITLKPCLALL